MKFYPVLFLLGVFLYTNSFAVDTTTIVCNDFTELSLWQLNGTCRSATNSDNQKVLRLTNSVKSQSGSAFIKNPIQLISDRGFLASFSANFSFQITNTGGLDEGTGAGADGLVFVIQTVANNVGSLGGGLGYRGIQHSLGIEFDTWNNPDSANDPDDNHIGIDTNGNTQSIKTYSEKTLFNNGHVWYVWIDYDGDNQMLEVRYDSLNSRPNTPKLSQKINLPALLVNENVYVGFTSATGLSYNTHDIISCNFVNKFRPYAYSLSLSVKPDTIVKANDSVHLISTIRDMSNIVQPDSSQKTQWRIIDAGVNSSSILKGTIGSEVLLVPEIADTKIKVEGKALINGQTLIDTVTITVKPGDVFQFKVSPNPDTVVKSHDKVTLEAMVFDRYHTPLSDSAKKTTWRILSADGNPESILQSGNGEKVDLIPVVPYSVVTVEAAVLINNQSVTDTIRIHVTAGDPYQIVIESDPYTNDLSFLRNAHPLVKLTFSKFPDDSTVFAVVRDRWGGYCRLADSLNSSWQVMDGADIITLSCPDHQKYIGQIKRSGPQGNAFIEVMEGNLIKDSLQIAAVNMYFDKIIIKDRESGKTLDSIIAKVKQNRTLDVYGLVAGADPQNDKSWMLVKADWSLSGDIDSIKNQLPKNNESWEMVAYSVGSGTLKVTSSDNAATHEITLPVTILSETTPYLVRAQYYSPSTSNSKGKIKITFSEDVDLKMLSALLPENTLLYFNCDGHTTKEVLGGAVYSDIPEEQFGKSISVQLGNGAGYIVPDFDSLSIAEGTVNKDGVAPDKQNIKKVPIEIQSGNISVTTSTNPFNLRDPISKLPQNVLNFYNNVLKGNNGNGVIIAVHSSIPLKLVGDSYGTADIYDPLGNIIRKNLHLELANSVSKTEYGFYWNGKNENNRNVGRGTYLIRIRTSDLKSSHVLNIKIGVTDQESSNK